MGRIREASLKKFNNINLIAIFDKDYKENTNNEYRICRSIDELLSLDIDAIFISAYVKFAAEYTIKALKARKHVFVRNHQLLIYQKC